VAAERDELVDLLDHPAETLEVEYKSSLDLDTAEHRATLACHIAAIANHGGGYLVFGFNDDLSLREPEHSASVVTRDVVSGVVKKYLEPAVNCDVKHVMSGLGRIHAVIIIPGHRAVPICAKAGGPERNSRPVGITKGTYYIRAIGPASVPITSASEWHDLIRRCVLHDRSNLLNALGAALRAPEPPTPQSRDILLAWHDATARALEEAVRAKWGEGDELLRRRKQFSYFIRRADGETLEHSTLRRTLEEINNEVKEHVQSGWSMFFPFGNRDYLKWNLDPSSGEEDDFLQINFATEENSMGRDFWRVSPSGKVSLIREYWEDGAFNVRKGIQVGTALDPHLVARDLAEVVWHASFLAARFREPVEILFTIEFIGLAGRQLHRFDGYRGAFGSQAAADVRRVTGVWPAAVLRAEWAAIVSTLATPIGRFFDAEVIFSKDSIAASADRFRRL